VYIPQHWNCVNCMKLTDKNTIWGLAMKF